MPDSSRIWIYNTNRSFSENELELIKTQAENFLKDWTSHGASMMAQLHVLYDRFIILVLDESAANASGCGIDKSVKFIKELGETLKTDLFQRTTVYYRQGDIIHNAPIHEFWAMKKAGLIFGDTILFDNTIQSLGDLRTKWEIPFKESWHQEMWVR